VALAMILLTVTGLLVRSVSGELAGDPGFDRTHLLTATVALPQASYPENQQQVEFFRRAAETLRRDARVQSASAVQSIPLGGSNSWSPVVVEGRAAAVGERNLVGFLTVLPDYFETMRVPLLAGRDFTDNDRDKTLQVAVVNQTMARRFWPDDPNPLGRRLRLEQAGKDNPWITIVGIARDVRHQGALRPARPEMYLPVAQSPTRRLILIARTHGEPAQAASSLRNAVWAVDRNQPVTELETMDELIDRRMAGPRVTVQILGFLAVLALLLAGLGIYGVLSYLTSQRSKEIGIRVAMGAVQQDIVRLVLSRGVLLAGLGLAVGAGTAAAVTPLVRSLLAGVEPHDPASFSYSAAALLAVAVFACVFPVVRALRLDPVRVLREE
jgi:putative ABC transport system permease protein